MAYPVSSRLGIRYLGNKDKLEVHGLHVEQTNCQIDEILGAGASRRTGSAVRAPVGSISRVRPRGDR